MLRNLMPSAATHGGTNTGANFSLGHRGPGSVAQPPRSAPASWGRHGSGARYPSTGYGGSMGITPPSSVSPRRRLRDEQDDQDRQDSAERGRRSSATRRLGPQATMDVDDEVSKLMNRVMTVEAMLRQHC